MTDHQQDSLRVQSEPRSVKLARAFVTSTLAALASASARPGVAVDRIDDAELLTSELVANAVIHGGGEVEVRVGCHDGLARVEVSDHDPSVPMVQEPTTDATGGRGLAIVQAVADRWGYIPTPGNGKSVWFELDLGRPVRSEPMVIGF